MTTKVIFNIPVKVKEAAVRRAKRDGMTLTTVLTQAARAYGAGTIDIDAADARPILPVVARALKRSQEDAKKDRNFSPNFTNAEEAIQWLRSQ